MPKIARPGCAPNAARERSRPAQREPHRALGLLERAGQADAFVELHLDVGAEQPLDLHRAFGRQLMSRAVDMRLENDAALVELAQLGEAHHLEPAGIGEDRVRPAHELVQAAEPRRSAPRRAPASDDRCCRARCPRPARAPRPGYIALTVAAVPTGMKAGVRIVPRGVEIAPSRAAPSRAWTWKEKASPVSAMDRG